MPARSVQCPLCQAQIAVPPLKSLDGWVSFLQYLFVAPEHPLEPKKNNAVQYINTCGYVAILRIKISLFFFCMVVARTHFVCENGCATTCLYTQLSRHIDRGCAPDPVPVEERQELIVREDVRVPRDREPVAVFLLLIYLFFFLFFFCFFLRIFVVLD